MNLYDVTVPHVKKSFDNLDRWIEKAHAFAATKKMDANALLTSRLAPDQYDLARQVMNVCDHGKFIVARTLGKDPPKHTDDQKTWQELRGRLKDVRAYVDGFRPADFDGVEERLLKLPWMQGKALTAREYVLEFARPNFDFHVVTTYAILRHVGVDVGKMDYIGGLPFRDL